MGGESLFIQKIRHVVSGKCKMTSMAALFVPVWDQALKVCQFAERPIQKKISCVSIPKIITHSILPSDTHTTNLAAIQRNKSVPACVCA